MNKITVVRHLAGLGRKLVLIRRKMLPHITFQPIVFIQCIRDGHHFNAFGFGTGMDHGTVFLNKRGGPVVL